MGRFSFTVPPATRVLAMPSLANLMRGVMASMMVNVESDHICWICCKGLCLSRLSSAGVTHCFRTTLSTAGNSMTSSERPSTEPLLKKEVSPAVLRGREFWKCFWASNEDLGGPSCTLEGNSRKVSESVSGVFSEFIRNFFRKAPAIPGCGLLL